jgi:hypothetical protein
LRCCQIQERVPIACVLESREDSSLLPATSHLLEPKEARIQK